jgi:transcription factor WhiB
VPQSAADVTWQEHAACAGAQFEFVPVRETVKEITRVRRTWCDRCPVWTDCLAYAVLYRLEGYWGGTSTAERRILAYPRNRQKCLVCKCKSLVRTPDNHEICQSCGMSWTALAPKETEATG